MIFAVDAHYAKAEACAAGVIFDGWADEMPLETLTTRVAKVAPYQPGAFYLRELPVLMALLEKAFLIHRPSTIVIDGYVSLGAEQTPGLGAHLHAALGGRIPVIGVAKTLFMGTPAETGVLRGGSARPLYVTAMGMDGQKARDAVRGMHGPHRIPTLLQQADRLCRDGLTGRA